MANGMTAIKRVSFIGMGNMGAPMAAHLIARGFDVTVFDIRRAAARYFASAHGGRVATSLAEAGRTAQAAITMLPDHTSVREALLQSEGIVSALESGAIAIDMSTSDPRATVSIGDELAQRGIGYLDAPVMGGVVFAKDGRLDILVGGDDAQIEKCMPLFMAMGRQVFHCGPLGSCPRRAVKRSAPSGHKSFRTTNALASLGAVTRRLSRVDREAMGRAVEQMRAENPASREQI